MIRAAQPADLNYVKSSFFESSKDSAVARSVASDLYRRRWTTLVDRLVARYTTTILADDVEPGVILGWVLHDSTHLIYVFVREDFRNAGRMHQLLAQIPTPKWYAFRTTPWQRISPRLAPSMSYDPTIAWAEFGVTHG